MNRTIKLMCPKCSHTVDSIPISGVCPNCNEYSHGWKLVDKKGYINLCKIKMYGNLIISLMFILSAIVFWGEGVESYNLSGGGKTGFFILALVLFSTIGSIFVGESIALSIGLLSIAITFILFSYIYYRKIRKSNSYKFHTI